MAFENTQSSISYEGDGENTIFTVPFPVLEASHLVVTATDADGEKAVLQPGTDYTAAIGYDTAGNPANATVTLTAPPAAGAAINIKRIVPLVQSATLSDQGGAQPKVVEKALNYLTMALQQMDTGAVMATVEAVQAVVADLGNDVMASDAAIQQEAIDRANADANLRTHIDTVTGQKANKTHAEQHAASGTDRIAPADIGAMPVAPNDGDEYHAQGDNWVKVGSISGLPEGGQIGDLIVNTGPSKGEWQTKKASVSEYGLAKVDGTTIVASDGVLTAVGGGGGEGGTTDHRALLFREAADSHPGTAISITGDDAALNAQTAIEALRTAVNGKADAQETQQALMQKADAASLEDYATTIALEDGLADKADKLTTEQALDGKEEKSALKELAYVADAPDDDLSYVRKNKSWHQVSAGSAIIGETRLLPFRIADLPSGWHFPSGDYFALTTPVGQALNNLPENYKIDWGVTISGENIRLFDPTKFFSGALGRFPRPVDGTSRLPGSVENDAIRNITGSITAASITSIVWPLDSAYPPIVKGALTARRNNLQNILSGNQGAGADLVFDASLDVPTADENRPYNIGMTPAVYLGV